jgi:hypothetical protein
MSVPSFPDHPSILSTSSSSLLACGINSVAWRPRLKTRREQQIPKPKVRLLSAFSSPPPFSQLFPVLPNDIHAVERIQLTAKLIHSVDAVVFLSHARPHSLDHPDLVQNDLSVRGPKPECLITHIHVEDLGVTEQSSKSPSDELKGIATLRQFFGFLTPSWIEFVMNSSAAPTFLMSTSARYFLFDPNQKREL